MKKFFIALSVLLLFIVAPFASAQAPLLAFPGAEGFGANTIGGRGGIVMEVTNLNDSGVGSLRSCVEANVPRTCVFKTGGLISLNSTLAIRNPYITIAGQTAPGGGITIKLGTSKEAFSTQTHDVIIRYISVRPGPGGSNHTNQIAKNGVELYNIIIDHNSLSWGVDSNIETWYRVRNATIQWSIISEGLNNSTHPKGAHSKGLMIGGYQGSESGGKGSEDMSVLNSLMAHNADRNPLIQMCGAGQVINNVTYNPLYTFSHQQLNCTTGASYVNWINNYHKKGPNGNQTDLKVIPSDGGTCSNGKVYLSGNVNSSGNWTTGFNGTCSAKSGSIITTVPAPAPAVVTTDALTSYNDVLSKAGNSAGVSCDGNWYARQDAIDSRIINEVKTGTGRIIDNPSQVGGWVTPDSGTPCEDADKDGMPNAFENIYGLNTSVADNNSDLDSDGYTNLEEYMNGTNPGIGVPPPTVAPTNTVLPTFTPLPTVTRTPTLFPTVTPVRTVTPLPTSTFTLVPTLTVPPTQTLIPTATKTPIVIPTLTFTPTPIVTPDGTWTCFEDLNLIWCYKLK